MATALPRSSTFSANGSPKYFRTESGILREIKDNKMPKQCRYLLSWDAVRGRHGSTPYQRLIVAISL
jgi:hypothetical protein